MINQFTLSKIKPKTLTSQSNNLTTRSLENMNNSIKNYIPKLLHPMLDYIVPSYLDLS